MNRYRLYDWCQNAAAAAAAAVGGILHIAGTQLNEDLVGFDRLVYDHGHLDQMSAAAVFTAP